MKSKDKKQIVIAIGGATASGKSGLALALAKKLNGTVINFDSMQLYKGLPILTAQPSIEDYKEIEHKLYSHLQPEENFSAIKWRNAALDEISRLEALDKTPILVGGTGFYLKALIEGLSPIPETDPEIRNNLIQKYKETGIDAFFKEFAKLDKLTSTKIDPSNSQRIIRAWEVLLSTGKPMAEWQKEPLIPPPSHLLFYVINLTPDREILYSSCNSRFKTMIDNGAIEEIKKFKEIYGLNPQISLTKALGYKELCEYIDGNLSLAEASEKASQITRNYAKRQTTWFKNQLKPDITISDPKNDAQPIINTVFDL